MEINSVKIANVNKVSKTRLRVTAMPKSVKFVVNVDSNIQIVSLFNELEKQLKSFHLNFKPVRIEIDGYTVSPYSTVGDNFENNSEIIAFSAENSNPLNFKKKTGKEEEQENLNQKRNRNENTETPENNSTSKKPKKKRENKKKDNTENLQKQSNDNDNITKPTDNKPVHEVVVSSQSVVAENNNDKNKGNKKGKPKDEKKAENQKNEENDKKNKPDEKENKEIKENQKNQKKGNYKEKEKDKEKERQREKEKEKEKEREKEKENQNQKKTNNSSNANKNKNKKDDSEDESLIHQPKNRKLSYFSEEEDNSFKKSNANDSDEDSFGNQL